MGFSLGFSRDFVISYFEFRLSYFRISDERFRLAIDSAPWPQHADFSRLKPGKVY
jgi:hypothetical protein